MSVHPYRPERVLAAWTACVAVCAVVLVVWSVGLGLYLEDFCLTQRNRTEWTITGGPTVAGPVLLACEQGSGSIVHGFDWRPLAWSLSCLTLVATLVTATILYSRRVSR